MSVDHKYNFALWEVELDSTDKILWLIDHFELYKTTLIWPPGFPPIPTCNMPKGTIRESFHSTYKKILSEFDVEMDNSHQKIKFK